MVARHRDDTIREINDDTATYGAIGTAIVTMRDYVSGVTILVGAVLNAVIEQRIRIH